METRALYAELTEGLTRAVRADDLVYAAAELSPGLPPTREQVAQEREKLQKDKAGRRSRRARSSATCSPTPSAGRHLIETMLRPTPLALDQLTSFTRDGSRRPRQGDGRAARATSASSSCATRATSTPRTTPRSAPLEAAIDLVLLDHADRDLRAARRRRRAPALRRPPHLRRRPEPHAPLPRPDLLPVLPGPRPRARAQGLPRAERAARREAVDRRGRDVRDRRRAASCC